MKEGRQLVKEAVQDAKSLKEVALEAAKREIVESMAPAVKALFEQSIRETLSEKRGLTGRLGQSQRADHFSPKTQKWEEGKDKGEKSMGDKDKKEKELDLESLASFFPQISEEPELGDEGGEHDMHEEPDPDADPTAEGAEGEEPGAACETAIPTLGEEAGEGDEEHGPKHPVDRGAARDEGDVDETVEISTEQLQRVYESALQTEVQVKKGFSDMSKFGTAYEVDPAAGLADVKKGEHHWNEETPPAKEDYQVKEAIKRGIAENKRLREDLKKAVGMIKTLGAKLHETNLFNSKVLHVNRILNRPARLTKEQKTVVMESIDKAKSISEVKMVYEAIVNTFTATERLSEARDPRKPHANAQRARTTGTPKPEILSESVDRAEKGKYSRLQELAGLLK